MRHTLIAVCAGLALCALPRPVTAGPMVGFDVMMSTVMQENQSSFSGLGLRARIVSLRLIDGVQILPTVEYWRNRSSVPRYDIDAVRRDATLGVDVRYLFRHEGWSPYAGAGYSLHFLMSEVSAPAFGVDEDRDTLTKGGLSAMTGINFPITDRIENFIELKFHNVTDYRQLKFSWGLTFDL